MEPTYRVKISGNRQRIEIVFSGIFFDASCLAEYEIGFNDVQPIDHEII
jgi:hypothetical protein